MIQKMKAGEKICQAALVRVQKIGNSSNGGVFAKGNLEDNSGRIQFITFDKDIVERLREFEAAKPMMIAGAVDIVTFSKDMALQVIINKMDKLLPEDDLTNLVPVGDFDHEEYKNKLKTLINSVKTISLKMLLEQVFQGEFLEMFYKTPAGMKVHHAYLGGLLQHTVDVVELACVMADKTPNVDKDLIIAGALLHDVGKVQEISATVGFPYPNAGRFLGLISMAVGFIRDAANEIKLPPLYLQELEHIILSHHGEREKGSPIECATKESFLVHYADEVNTIMNQFENKETKGNWEYNKILQRYLYIKE